MMTTLDERGRRAAESARLVAARMDAEAMLEQIEGRRQLGWLLPSLATAAAFAVTVAALIVLQSAPTTTPGVLDVPDPDTTSEPEPTTTCSARDLSPEIAPQERLPEPVAAMRAAIAAAAVACDYARLAELARAGEHPFTESFGGPVDELAVYWRQAEDHDAEPPPLATMRRLLDLDYTVIAVDTGAIYTWPAAFAEDANDGAVEELIASGVYTREQYQQDVATFGGYAGYRLGIAADGEWRYFVAGD